MYEEQNKHYVNSLILVAFLCLIIALCSFVFTFGTWRIGNPPSSDDVHAVAYDFRWQVCRVERMYDPAATSFVWTNPDGSSLTMPCPDVSAAPLPWPTTVR